jgi:hypothetical protein
MHTGLHHRMRGVAGTYRANALLRDWMKSVISSCLIRPSCSDSLKNLPR